MYQKYGDRVQFYLVYIREAHPTDERQVPANRDPDLLIKQPTSLEERTEVAQKMCQKLELKLPAIIDTLDDAAGRAYSAWPDRLYLVDGQGRIAYKGRPGPGGFRPDELEAAIQRELNAAR